MPTVTLELRGTLRPAIFGRGSIPLSGRHRIPLCRAFSPSLRSAYVHRDGSIVVGWGGIGGIVLSSGGSVSKGAITSSPPFHSSSKGVVMKGFQVSFSVRSSDGHGLEFIPVLRLREERENSAIQFVVQPLLEEIHDRFGVVVVVGFVCQFFEQGYVLIHVVVFDLDMFDFNLGGLFALGVEETLSELMKEVVPCYNVIVLAGYPRCHLQFPSSDLLSLNQGQGEADFIAVVQDIGTVPIEVDVGLQIGYKSFGICSIAVEDLG